MSSKEFVIENGVLIKYWGPGGEVVIPEGVTSIGERAFFNCKSLESVTIQTGVTCIGEGAFMRCSSLKSVMLPESMASIGDYAFAHCPGLTEVTIPASVARIGDSAFYGCERLLRLDIPASVPDMGEAVFANTKLMAGCQKRGAPVVLGGKLYAYGDRRAKHVTVPDGVTAIGEKVFMRRSELKSVTLPAGLRTIADRAFRSCVNLEEVVFQEGLETVGVSTFKGCISLRRLWLPDGVKSLGEGCFYGCEELEELSFPAGIDWIGTRVFSQSIRPKKIEIRGDGDTGAIADALRKAPGVQVLADMLLAGQLDSRLGKGAAEYIRKDLGKYAWQAIASGGGEQMRRFLALWEDKPLGSDELDKYIKLAAEAKNAEAGAQLLQYKSAHYSAVELDVLEQEKMDKALGVKEMTLADWRKIFKIVVKDGVATITGLKAVETNVTIPGTIGKNRVVIGERAFFNCHSLTDVTIQEGVLTTGFCAFSGCENLTSLSIPASVTSIGSWAFERCPNLIIYAPAGSYAEEYLKRRISRSEER